MASRMGRGLELKEKILQGGIDRVPFLPDGPEIPLRLLEQLEEERVVFFCGAGVSAPAGLPMFEELVRRVYENLRIGMDRFPDQKQAFEQKQYDVSLGLLERHVGATKMRREVWNILQFPSGPRKRRVHNHVLDLALTKDKKYRLVTTNFDSGFMKHRGRKVSVFAGPLLRTPKIENLTNPVYLHGAMTKSDEETRDLILTSADFGRAYLTERWASRFVTDLFRYFDVVFIGYSIQDPVMRYITDALANDRATIGETTINQAYIFDWFDEEAGEARKQEFIRRQWENRGIVPVLYHAPDKNHGLLIKTLELWAREHRLGFQSKLNTIHRYGNAVPPASSREPILETKRLVWALKDQTGLPAREFSNLPSTPNIKWLRILEELGVLAEIPGEQFESQLSAWRGTFTAPAVPLSKPAFELMKWFCKNLYTDEAVKFAVESSGRIHPSLKNHIKSALANADEREQASDRLQLMRQFWHIVTTHRLAPPDRFSASQTLRMLKSSHSLDDSQKASAILSMIRPYYLIRAPYTGVTETGLRSLARWEVGVCDKYTAKEIQAYLLSESNTTLLERILPDVVTLLGRAWQMMESVQQASPEFDHSYIHHKSVPNHPQNTYQRDWTFFVSLIYEGAVRLIEEKKLDQVLKVLSALALYRYPIFRRMRLAIYAQLVAEGLQISSAKRALFEDRSWWFWSLYTKREKHLLMKALVDRNDASRIVSVILKGPRRKMYRNDLTDEEWPERRDQKIYDQLSKIEEYGLKLPLGARQRFDEIQDRHPEWRPTRGEKGEFASWVTSGWRTPDDPVPIEWQSTHFADVVQKLDSTDQYDGIRVSWKNYVRENPRKGYEFLKYIQKECEATDFGWAPTLEALHDAAKSTRKQLREFWNTVVELPLATLQSQLQWLTGLLSADADQIRSKAQTFRIYDRLLPIALLQPTYTGTDVTMDSVLSHSVGHLVEMLIDNTWPQTASKNMGVPATLVSRLNRLLANNGEQANIGKLVMATKAIPLHYIDRRWAVDKLKPLFAPENPLFVPIWDSYLHQPRLTPDFAKDFADEFIAAFGRELEFDSGIRGNLFQSLAVIALDFPTAIQRSTIREILAECSLEALGHVASYVRKRYGHPETSESEWEEYIWPFIKKCWPVDLDRRSAKVSEAFSRLIVARGTGLCTRYSALKHYICPFDNVYLLCKDITDVMAQESVDRQDLACTLDLLRDVVAEQNNLGYEFSYVRFVIDRIRELDQHHRTRLSYTALDERLRRHGYPPGAGSDPY